MSFGGFTNFAKNALLTAQKHIDSALHIEEEVEDEEDDNTMDDEEAENGDNISRTETKNLGPKHSESEDVGFLDVDLNGAISPPHKWGEESCSNNQEIVDTEPNPIRDAHEPTNIFHYSPPSSQHSPDDDDGSQNGHTSSTTNNDLEVSLINLEKEKATHDDLDPEEPRSSGMTREASEKTLDRFEEVRTIASSDIEVIRQMDDWSIASSQNHKNQKKQSIDGINLKEMLAVKPNETFSPEFIPKPPDPTNESSHQELTEQVAVLIGKLKHRDQRIEELGRLNENLKASNANLSAKFKQKTSTETKLLAQLSEKEKQLNDLLGEGKKLSEYSGRQAKEIRKLKQQLSQLELVTAARDSAMEELQEAHHQIQEQEAIIEQLREDVEKTEKSADQLSKEMEKGKTELDKMEKNLCEQMTQLEKANAELKRMEKEARKMNKEKEELIKENRQLSAKLMNKTAQERMGDERERGLLEDLDAERNKNAVAANRIRELEERFENLQDAQRDIALEISNANSPLLHTITGLEEKIVSLERQNEGLTRALRQTNEQIAHQRSQHEMEIQLARKDMEELQQNNVQKSEELNRALADRAELQRKLKQMEEEMAMTQKICAERVEQLESRLDGMDAELKAKRAELHDLEKKNHELQQKAAAMAKSEQRNGTFPAAGNTQPPMTLIKGDGAMEDSTVRAQFQQQRNALKSQNSALSPSKKKFSTSSPTQSRADMDVSERATPDYMLDIAPVDHLRTELDTAQAQLFQLHERFDHLLELYGGCLENIEELKEDNEDLRKLCKEQALRLSEMEGQETTQMTDSSNSKCEELFE